MMMFAAALTFLALTTQTDTTLAVKPGMRLEVTNFSGSVEVSGWNRNTLRLEAEHSTRTTIEIETSESAITVSTSGRRGHPGSVEFRIMVPRWMPLSINGPFTDVSVEGTKGGVAVETVKGDVNVKGGGGLLRLSTVQGEVTLEGARGRAKLGSVNGGITISDMIGDVDAETVNGDVVFDHVRSSVIDASTVSGSLNYLGDLLSGGRYQFESHSGDVDVSLLDNPAARIVVSTFSGEFDSDFEVKLNELRRNRRFEFTLGSGSAQLGMESFSGSIRLRRAAAGASAAKKPHEEESR